MKRSEAIEEIESYLYHEMQARHFYHHAKTILKIVEDELGMLPPNRLVDTDERDHTWDDVEDSDDN